MAFQISAGGIVKTPGIGMVLAGLKFQLNNTASPKILAGNEIISAGATPGSIKATTGASAAVATIVLNSSIIDLTWCEADLRDDGQIGNYVTHGNVANEGTSNLLSFNVGAFANTGTALTGTSSNGMIIGVAMLVRNVGVNTGN